MSELTATEALNSFIGWLTCRDEVVKIGASEDCAVWAELIDKFSRANNLSEPRSIWPENAVSPSSSIIKLNEEPEGMTKEEIAECMKHPLGYGEIKE